MGFVGSCRVLMVSNCLDCGEISTSFGGSIRGSIVDITTRRIAGGGGIHPRVHLSYDKPGRAGWVSDRLIDDRFFLTAAIATAGMAWYIAPKILGWCSSGYILACWGDEEISRAFFRRKINFILTFTCL
jgi:hypothetical protein